MSNHTPQLQSIDFILQQRYFAVKKLQKSPSEEQLWNTVLLYAGEKFYTYSGLPFTYEIRRGRNGNYTKELWIDRRTNSKSLAWSSVLLAFNKVKEQKISVARPKDLGDIRGITYIYSIFLRFGLIEATDIPGKKSGKKSLKL